MSLFATNTRWVCLFGPLVPLRGVGDDIMEEGTFEVDLEGLGVALSQAQKGEEHSGQRK